MDAEDLVAAVFPDQLACPENLVGDREIPDHPLVKQTIEDCLLEAMDFPGLKRVLVAMEAGDFQLVARDTPEPSPLAHEVLNAKPYAFLDDAPLEERRTQAVITRRGLDVKTADEFGRLDDAAIDRVKDEAWPDPRGADELHDALLVMGAVTEGEGERGKWERYFEELVSSGRAATLLGTPRLWIAAERLPLFDAVTPGVRSEPPLTAPERERAKTWTREDALRELVRGRLESVGPTTARELAASLGVTTADSDFALGALEH
jgi:ATP-dependent Lhr-like helicase